jgi:hypothetical protein
MAGCHGGRRTSMRPKFFSSTSRSQVVVDQGYTTVESPGAIIQQQQGAIVQQQTAPGGQASEPPIVLEPRQGGTTSSIVPSFGDARTPLEPPGSGGNGESTILMPRDSGAKSSVIDNLAPPAEAPNVLMEKPPMTNLDNSSIDSTLKKQDTDPNEEPRLEVIPPGTKPGVKNPETPAGSGVKDAPASKTSAWRTQRPSGGATGRITYQASSRKNIGTGQAGDPLGIID